ncbi:MAG TPA: amino acid adenylation domain-containing protein, partial [Longimicrobium sp.]|nr:amino acid adenylation domain-containing protein [Longimicrobium sp.]
PAGACVHDLFRAQAAWTPEAVALSWRGEQVTYAELEARANRLANALRRRGVGPEVRVGICLPRTPDLVAAMLGVLGAGGAYVPLDPAYPRERLGFMLQDAGITLVITASALAEHLPENAAALLLLDGERDAIAAESADAPESGVDPENLSHLIFTSGSTGRPKGVMIRHASVVVLLHWLRETMTDEERSSVLFSTSINFDVSVAEIFGTLAWGGKLVLVENALALAELEEAVVHASMSPSAAAELLHSGGIPACVKTLSLGGEALPNALAQGLYRLGTVEKVGNLYGPTEDTTYSTYAIVPRGAEQVLIGTPVANTRVYVLDPHLQPVPIGVAGELYLAGDGLSRGYASRPGMTAERFLPCPFGEPGSRMYRVMDRVRWKEVRASAGDDVSREDASTFALSHSRTFALEYLGRTDFQVKVRSYRIELGEIEARLAEHPGVRAAVAVVREDTPGDRRLVAYVAGNEAAGADVLRAHLSERLPGYMVPAAYVRLDALPLTPNGKVDRQALPAPQGDAFARGAYEAPESETERALAGIWSEVLGVERVGRRDRFPDLGGHSLLAVRVVSRVRQALGADVAPGELFDHPALADFARWVESAPRAEMPAIEPVDRGQPLALSFAQQRLWFMEQLGGAGNGYQIPWRLRLRGELDRAALARALDRVVARHEALRTTFAAVDGEPVQRIAPVEASAFPLVEHDLRGRAGAEAELLRLADEESAARFDLARGPLFRGRLVRMADDDHVLLLTLHHAVSDGWSMGVLADEVGALYGAFRRGDADPLPPLPVQYADYAAWQRRLVQGETLDAQAAYWSRALAGAPERLELPTDRPHPARRDPAGASLAFVLDEALAAGLNALSRRHGTTLFTTVLAGWAAVLGRLSGQDDVVVGVPAANRGRREIEGLIGLFVNPLALRVDLSGSPTVAELMARVKARALEAQRNQDIPFEQVVERVSPARNPAHHPLFQVMLAWQNAPAGRVELPGLEPAPVAQAANEAAPFDLSLVLAEEDGRLAGGVTYATALLDRATVERHVGYLRRALEAMAADEGRPVERLPLLGDAERARVVEEWNATDAAYPRELCVHELFEARVERTPDAVAVAHEGETLTYADLNRRANRLAHHLRALGVGPDVRVAVSVERGVEMVAGVLAVLKAGGAYVPLDPAYPAERLRYMLEDSAPAVLLAGAALAERFAGVRIPVVALGADASGWAEGDDSNPARAGLTPDHLAYVIYTSGSTGRPKGVMVQHRGVCNLALAQIRDFAVEPASRVLQFASFSFDACVSEIFTALGAGAALHLPPRGVVLAGDALLQALAAGAITHVTLPPAVLGPLPDDAGLGAVQTLVVAGDVATAALVQRWAPGRRLLNAYGPTEATVCATMRECGAGERGNPPIGGPIANVRTYVLDGAGEPVPAGVVGELYVGGAGVARGYLGRPGLTAGRFVPDSFGGTPGARLYRTGDLARWLADGALEFVGRADGQVKVRGFRVETGEIEARLAEHPDVREAAVLAREDARGDRRLVAYWVGGEVAAEALRAHLAERLPEYMVPAAYVRMETLPLTPNGKLDRGALPAPEGDAFAARAYEAPASEAERAVAEIWSELLGVERVGRGDHFFELGGHSLLAVQVGSRVRRALGAEVAPGELFDHPVLTDFARSVQSAARAEMPAIQPVDRGGPLAPSFAQQRLWFLEQLGGMGVAYHIPVTLRLRGVLDRGALVRALDRIVARHEALRTSFPTVDGEPVQHIAPAEESGLRLVEHDLHASVDAEDALVRLMRDEAGAPFDLAQGPLVRGRLVRMAADDHVLLLTMHHIVSDGWSAGVLHRELGALYAAFARGEPDPLPPLPVQYADYAAWHRRRVEGPVLEAQAEYWTRTLAGAPELLELPTDHPRPAKQDFAGASLKVALDEALTGALKTLSQRHGATLHMTLLAGWAAVLARLSGQDDVVIGTPSANRGHAEIEGLIGFFVNTLPVRVELSGAPTVAGLLGQVRARALEAQQNQDIPFEQVVERVQPARSLAHTPLFQVLFAWQNAPGARLELPGLALGPLDPADSGDAPAQVSAKFDLALSLWEEGGRIEGMVEYATALFEPETVERWLGYLRRVLDGMVAEERGSVERLELLSAAERRRVVEEWNATDAAFPADACVHDLFEAQAARTPDAVAVAWNDETLSYAALDHAANRLANHLRRRGVGPETRVGICLERGPEQVVALLAVLKAGGAYVPLDPAYPAERLGFMLADSGAPLLLTRLPLPEGLAPHAAEVVCLDADRARIEAESAQAPAAGVLPDHLAYVIYTSGSTGTPKGVMVPHRGVPNLAYAQARRFGIDSTSRVLQFASFSFDAAVAEVFGALLAGATLVMASRDALLPGAGLLETLRRGRVTVATLPPSVLAMLAPEDLPELRTVVSAGEAVDAATVERWSAGRVFVNAYGPTEVTVCATSAHCEADGRAPAIGRPLENVRVYVLDAAGRPAPVGVAGELYVGGVGVARGYLGRPGLTAERFVPDPFSTEGGARLYRTGDRVRWSARGELEFLGRLDEQVKVRGFRVEPGEIEARLAEHAGVREAVVLVREDVPGEKRLVAYVVGDADAETLRAHLSERLPEYMVPAAYVRLDALPLTPNGKVDRKALPAPDGDAFATRGYEAPSGRAEEAVAAIWAELLGAERVGRSDHFFDLGGHSLLAVRVVSRVRQALGVEAVPGDLFERPVLADFARGLETAARAEAMAIAPVDRSSAIPLSFAQQRLWFLEQMGNLGSTYHIPTGLRLRGELDRGALVRSLDRIVARHEALRTTFPAVDGEPVQHIAPAGESAFRLVEHDLRASADAEDALHRLMADEASAPFNLARGPLVRGRLIRMAADDHVLLMTMHHIVSDGWSMGVLHRELGVLYAAFMRGEPDPLPPLPLQYADYAAWHRRSVEGDVLEAQAAYWTQTLGGAPELLELPADRPRPAKQDFAGASLQIELDEALTEALKRLSQRHGTTLYMTLLAGWAAVLARLSGQDEVVIGTPSANRGRSEIEGLIGFFVNTLPLRVDLSHSPSVVELLAQVRARALEAQRNQDIPFEQVVERLRPVRSLAHSPLFQVMFAWQDTAGESLDLPGLQTVAVSGPAAESAKFDLLLTLAESGDRIVGEMSYATALFDRGTVERCVGYLRRALGEMAADERQPVERVELLSAAERRRVVEEWNATDAAFPAGACVHELFEAQVERTPGAVAVSFQGEGFTYAELNARANRLAHHLRGLGVGPDARVGICVERGPEMIAGLLGILKAGGAYVPLDPAYPADRLRYMLEDSAPAALVTQSSLAGTFAGLDVPVVELDAAAWAEGPETNPVGAGLTPGHLAYVIYTSGSTGRPKGVMVEHRSLVNHTAWQAAAFGIGAGDTVLQRTSISFDASVWELWTPLATGARMLLLSSDAMKDPEAIGRVIQEGGVTVAQFVPVLLHAVLGALPAGGSLPCRVVFCGGEPLSSALVEEARAAGVGEVVNLYGPTEATIDSTSHVCAVDGRAPAIGRPIANARMYVLDARG